MFTPGEGGEEEGEGENTGGSEPVMGMPGT